VPAINLADFATLENMDKQPSVSGKSNLVQDESGAWHDTRTLMFAREQLLGTPSVSARNSAATGVTALKKKHGVTSAQAMRKTAQEELDNMSREERKLHGLSRLRQELMTQRNRAVKDELEENEA
jgi:hypothetical protein